MSDSTSRIPRHDALFALQLLPALTALGFGWWMLARRQYLLVDDAYISFRYAANFANGHGLVWNVGTPVEGYTCLLWVLLLSLFARAGLALTLPGVTLSVLFGLGCLELLRRIDRMHAPADSTLAGIVPCMLLACLPSFAHAMTSAMEETCFAFFVLLGLHLLILGRTSLRLRLLSGLAFAGASLTRPEGPLVAGVALAVEAVQLSSWRLSLRRLAAPALCVAIVVFAHTAFRLAYYGYPLPNTFYAKVIFGPRTVMRGLAHLWAFCLAGGWMLLLGFPGRTLSSSARPWVVHGYAVAVTYCAYLLFVGGDHPHWFRFYIPLLPLPLLGLGLRLRAARHRGPWLQQRAWRQPVAFGIGCIALALAALPYSEAYEPIVGVIDRPTKKLMDDVDEFFSQVPKHSFCAVAPIGHVGYRHLDLHILDTWGLTDTHIAHLEVAPAVKFGHDKQDNAYVASMKPDYLYIFAFPPMPLPGYDLCWPSNNPPAAVYRRAMSLTAADVNLGVGHNQHRYLEPPPACRPPSFVPITAGRP